MKRLTYSVASSFIASFLLFSAAHTLHAQEEKNPGDYLQIRVGNVLATLWDVPKSSWFYSAVNTLAERGIVSGYKHADGSPTGEYGPGNNVTRAEAMKIALGAAGVTQCVGTAKHPQTATHWVKPYVPCAESMGFGLTNDQDLNGAATRAEVLHYVLRSFAITPPEGTPPFEDSLTHQYKNDIAYAQSKDIVTGDKNEDGSMKGTFRPNDGINRAEIAQIAVKAMEMR